MISLARHIELLLLEHNCVIVPGLGGFIANTASAVYNDGPDGDKLFMPPYRTIGFNPQLQVNDGLLVQSYMQVYDASYPAACLQMEKEIEQLNSQLNLFGEYILEGIGTLHKSLGKGIVLTSPEAGILTPSLYGTYSFAIKSIAEVIREMEIQEAANKSNIMPIQTEGDFKIEEKKGKEDGKTDANAVPATQKDNSKKKTYWMDISIAVAASAIIFFAFLIPNIKNMKGETETCVAGSIYIDGKTTQKSEVKPTIAETTAPEVKETKTQETQKVKKENNTDVPENKIEAPKEYSIVLASGVIEANAKEYIASLAKKGYSEAKFVKTGKINRIVYSSFATEKEAFDAILSLRKECEEFSAAWPMKMN